MLKKAGPIKGIMWFRTLPKVHIMSSKGEEAVDQDHPVVVKRKRLYIEQMFQHTGKTPTEQDYENYLKCDFSQLRLLANTMYGNVAARAMRSRPRR